MININEVVKQNIKISNKIINKLKFGFIFDNKDFCNISVSIILINILKNISHLNLNEEQKENLINIYNKLYE